jgi:hypothetical protein
MMFELKKFCLLCLLMGFSRIAFGADVILNEYNAVYKNYFLNGGNSSADSAGGRASDSYFGRVKGNGGDWFELVVITDHLNMSNWQFVIEDDGSPETLTLTDHAIWLDIRSGTIITVSEDLPSDISYNPSGGDWWINVQANDLADGLYITKSNFPVSQKSWQLQIKDADGNSIFGPAGEGVSPASGIGDKEIFRLETKPDATITRLSTDYDSGKNLSTFGAANRWGNQSLLALRSVVAEFSAVSVLYPSDPDIIMGGTIETIAWETIGTINDILIEFSIDDGDTWTEVCPPNLGNTGSYQWLVPIVDSQQCKVRLVNAADLEVYDVSDEVFTIYECPFGGDLTGNCFINMEDLAIMALYWMQEGNPYE